MIITLSQINQSVDGVFPFQGQIQLADLVEEETVFEKLDPVQVKGEASILRSHLYQINVEQKCVGKLSCSRCLTTFPTSLEAVWSEKFTDKLELSFDTEDETIHYVADGQVDLTPYVREQLFIHLPYAPVCKPDCTGLCPVCGINKNEATCNCNTERIDPRLAKLQNLFTEGKDSVS